MWDTLVRATSTHLATVLPFMQAATSASSPEAAVAFTAANLAIATSNSAGVPSGSALTSGLLTSYVVEKVAHAPSALVPLLQIDSGAIHVSELATCVRASPVKDTARITSLAMMQSTSTEEFVVQQTRETLGHRFVVATIELKDSASGERVRTFARVDFWGKDAFREQPVSQVVMLADDPDVLQREARELGRVSGRPEHADSGPTLGEFASLLELIHSRTPDYNVLVRNCYWHSETVFLCVTRAYSADWLAGSVRPAVLVNWIQRECDSVACIVDMAFAGGALQNFTAATSAVVGLYRWGLANLAPEAARVAVPEEDIHQIVKIWHPAGRQ